MPTKKRRVGFIPRSNVLDLINKLSFESNLSVSKIINILVEEALYKRGLFNNKTGTTNNNEYKNDSDINNDLVKEVNINNKQNYDFKNNFLNHDKKNIIDCREEPLDKEIYAKFLMFLQFQERMRERDL